MTQFDTEFESLTPQQQQAVLSELKRLASRYLSKEHRNHTLQTTELVNEAYANLAGREVFVEGRSHFMALAARQMRRILVDHARRKMAVKRDFIPVEITISAVAAYDEAATHAVELLHIDKLLTDLGSIDERCSRVMELKLFSNLNNSEIASYIGVSLATAERDLKAARAWIKTELVSNQ